MRRHLGHRPVDVVVVPLAAGDDQRGRVRPVGDRPGPAADQVGHVLARLLGAQERHVAGVAEAEPGADARLLLVAGRVERRVVDAVVGHVDVRRVGVEQADQLVAGGLARHDHARGPAQRGLDGAAEEGPPGVVVVLRLGEERRVVDGDGHRAAGPQRARVERRVQHLRADLLGEQRQPGLLPGQPRGAVGDGGRAGDHLGAGEHPGITLRIRPLRDDGEIEAVRAEGGEGTEQTVDVSADTASVGGDARGVDEDTGRTTGGHVQLLTSVGQTTGKRTPLDASRVDRDPSDRARPDFCLPREMCPSHRDRMRVSSLTLCHSSVSSPRTRYRRGR